MDRHALFALIPVLGILFTGLIGFSFTRLGRALANRIEGRVGDASEQRLQQLEAEVELLRQELMEIQERQDFAERMIAREEVQQRLPPAPGR